MLSKIFIDSNCSVHRDIYSIVFMLLLDNSGQGEKDGNFENKEQKDDKSYTIKVL